MSRISLNSIEYVTLYTGDNGTASCTCNCPCCTQKNRKHHYQGNMRQAEMMFEKLANLKQLYLFGNPDVTVDPDFCNQVMKEASKRNIHVCFSTSGIGGKEVLIKLLKDIPQQLVDYISFSFDGTTEDEMSFFKGVCYPMKKALDGLKWAIENGYKVKVQPTLWPTNYKKVSTIIEFFVKMGVKWFTFHIGSQEAGIYLETHKHLNIQQMKEVHKQVSEAVDKYDVKVRCPVIYKECGENEISKWYCMHPERIKEVMIIFTEAGVQVTHMPMASCYRSDLLHEINEIEKIDILPFPAEDRCPFGKQFTGGISDDSYCRFASKYWNY